MKIDLSPLFLFMVMFAPLLMAGMRVSRRRFIAGVLAGSILLAISGLAYAEFALATPPPVQSPPLIIASRSTPVVVASEGEECAEGDIDCFIRLCRCPISGCNVWPICF